MPWTTVPTFTSGQILTAAQMNGIGNDLTVLRGDYGSFRRTAGNLTLNSTSWADLPTIGTTFDITLAAATGDVIEAGFHLLVNSSAVVASFDVITVVGSTKTNSLTLGGAVPATYSAYNGSGFYCEASREIANSGSITYTAQSGDISSSTIKLRAQYATSAAVNRTLFAATTNPFYFWARNHGPVEI